MRNKKELLEVVLVFILGVLLILTICLNAHQYDKKFPNNTIQISHGL